MKSHFLPAAVIKKTKVRCSPCPETVAPPLLRRPRSRALLLPSSAADVDQTSERREEFLFKLTCKFCSGTKHQISPPPDRRLFPQPRLGKAGKVCFGGLKRGSGPATGHTTAGPEQANG